MFNDVPGIVSSALSMVARIMLSVILFLGVPRVAEEFSGICRGWRVSVVGRGGRLPGLGE